MAHLTERAIQAQIMKAVGSLPGIRLWRQNAGRVATLDHRDVARAARLGLRIHYIELAPKGAADLTGVIAPSGRLLQIEVKRPGAYLRADQLKWREIITKFGGAYILAHSVDEALDQLT